MVDKRFFVLWVLVLFIYSLGVSQKSPVFLYDFDQCSLAEKSGFGNDAKVSGNFACNCGINGDGFAMSGQETLELGQDINQIFSKDFSIDFYVNLTSVTNTTDLLSIQSFCDLDSSIYMRYVPQSGEIVVELAENVSQYYILQGKVDAGCWNRVTLIKSELNYTLVINNMTVGLAEVNRNIPIGRNARVRFSGSPCGAGGDDKLVGLLDEIAIYNRALSRQDLVRSYVFPDRISTKDTTIFKGSEVEIMVGAECADNFTWTPTAGLDDPNSLNVIASPEESTTYELALTNNGCEEISTITINVVEEQDKKCADLLIPAAFTPNNDDLNDDIGISNTFIVDEIKSFQIIDRWGGWVTTLQTKADRWNGTKDGQSMPGGSYVYKISYTCENQTYSKAGSFLLLK
ncbi:MAG: T9SS type B sorting domain-containing protein [Saprospiraceae bacterium]|nr:T9SS type B sorting domain-containing protein [Saprospiraceae bacterium]MBK8634172.1 T9SS type B sorting domain-containing protein [Saprospiraceae bacterium]MBP7642653.1 T9SS type B sorting domain-containing protein [Saprospiraceae bacterium]